MNAKLKAARQPLAAVTAGVMLAMLQAPVVLADDTDIYVQALPPGTPNVLLVLDTSGSMSSDVIVGTNYDPSNPYSLDLQFGQKACSTGRVYYARNVTGDDVPTCDPLETTRYVDTDFQKCADAIDALNTTGVYQGKIAQWDPEAETWGSLLLAEGPQDTPGNERYIECEADFGIHGKEAGDAEKWPAQGDDGPWADISVSDGTEDDDGDDDDGDGDGDDADIPLLDWGTIQPITLYAGNYIDWLLAERDTAIQSRLDIVKQVAADVVVSLSGVRLGVMRFSQDGDGGMVLYPVSDLEIGTKRDLVDAIRATEPGGTTPLAETMYEAHQYYGGKPVLFGLDSVGNNGTVQPSIGTSTDPSGSNYVSPITTQCQQNYIVLLTDGLPVSDSAADGLIQGLMPGDCGDSCLDEVSKYMSVSDMAPINEKQVVETFTIGFFTDDPLLSDTATANDDGDPAQDYYLANDPESLLTAFTNALDTIVRPPDTFNSPAISVDSFNRLTNLDDLYFNLYVPTNSPHWAGNVKGYRLAQDGVTIVDANGAIATDPLTGEFLNTARSYWTPSDSVDGADVTAGGLRNLIGTSRRIFTNLTGDSNVSLTAADNAFTTGNTLLTASLLNVDEADRDAFITLLRGEAVDAEGEAITMFGDSLHSVPAVVTFSGGQAGDRNNQRMFVATNDGFLHGFDLSTETPTETFAFVPRDQLSRLDGIGSNQPLNPPAKHYGLDGPISFWIENDDGDRVVDPGETLYLYFSMRRGGRNYYAIRIEGSAPDNPELAWTIQGGAGDFKALGQTWSGMTVADLSLGSFDGTALVFGGGYDPFTQDVVGPPSADSIGRAVYIVNAATGARLWWGGNPAADASGTPDLTLTEMTNSVPSDIRVVDTNFDGKADRMYFGDMGSRLWRLDLTGGVVTGTVLADLGGNGNGNNRRFYYPPSVARVIDPTFGSLITVSIGSGHRASPLSGAVDDDFYMIKDYDVFGPPRNTNGDVSYRPTITLDQLLDISNDLNPDVEALDSARGWRLQFATAAEKVLAPALTADNKVFFTTYVPGSATPSCDFGGVLGSGRLYGVDLLSGAPVLQDEVGDAQAPSRFSDLDRGGIPPAPVPIFTPPCGEDCADEPGDDNGDPNDDDDQEIPGTGCANPLSQVTLLIATQTADPNICNAPVRTYWSQGNVGR